MLAIGRFSAFLFVVLAGLLCLSGVSSRPNFITGKKTVSSSLASSLELRSNGERMSRGLPPLKPRQFYSPTKAARAATASALPAITGRILVRKASTGVSVGYISSSPDTYGQYNVVSGTNVNLHLKTQFTPAALATTSLNIAILPVGGVYPLLGFAGKNTALTGSVYNTLTATKETASGSVPSNVGNDIGGSSGFSESSIWLYDSSTTKLTAIWINPAPGKATVTTEFYAPSSSIESGILQFKSGSNAPVGYQKVTLEIAV